MQVHYSNTTDPYADLVDLSLVTSTGEAAEPTSRQLDGSEDNGYTEEWREPAVMPDGTSCYKMYLFSEDDITYEDGEPRLAEDYPWDDEHVRRVVLAD